MVSLVHLRVVECLLLERRFRLSKPRYQRKIRPRGRFPCIVELHIDNDRAPLRVEGESCHWCKELGQGGRTPDWVVLGIPLRSLCSSGVDDHSSRNSLVK